MMNDMVVVVGDVVGLRGWGLLLLLLMSLMGLVNELQLMVSLPIHFSVPLLLAMSWLFPFLFLHGRNSFLNTARNHTRTRHPAVGCF